MLTDDALAGLAGRCALILGDVMLDEYLWGDVQRISPEAPVPVVEVRKRTHAPGGAANVAANVAALGGRAIVVGVIGADPSAEVFRRLMAERAIDIESLIETPRPTTTKTRVIAHQQQVLRYDQEERRPLPREFEDKIQAALEARVGEADVCVISDYAKGVVTGRLASGFIELARRNRKPVIVDPKTWDFSRFRGSEVVTPNLAEAYRAAGVDPADAPSLDELGGQLMRQLDGSAVLITRGADGMSLFQNGGREVHISSLARSVFDVTGAGDTMVGTLALARAAGKDLETAARLANIAAGIVVGRFGAATVSLDELREGLPGGEGARSESVSG